MTTKDQGLTKTGGRTMLGRTGVAALVLLGAAALVLIVLWRQTVKNGDAGPRLPHPEQAAAVRRIADAARDAAEREPVERGGRDPVPAWTAESSDESAAENAERQTEDEKREAEEEKLVNGFDDLTDKWQEPSAKGVTMADVDNFVKQFRKVPKARQDECIHRALNLVPDENVMLLAGVLMDQSVDKEIVETVYNDILNRDEDVKKPILQQILKDKSHPCWADTAWILDVTGELPEQK